MKTRAAIVLLLLAVGCLFVQAQLNIRNPFFVAGVLKPAAGGGACASSQTTNIWDEVLEGFQTATTGYENTWTEVGTTANISEAADSSALTTGKPDGACSQAWKLTVPTDGTETYAYWNRGSSIDLDTVQTFITFNFYIETGPDAAENFELLEYENGATPTANGVRLRNTGGQLQIIAFGDSGGDAINISAGQWYTCKVNFDTANAVDGSTLSLWSSGSLIGSDTYKRAVGIDLQYVFIGAVSDLDINDSGTVWIDLVSVKTN